MLPGINSAIDHAQPGTGRHVLRLRELAAQNMVEGTARARFSRAMNIKTRVSGQAHDDKLAELMDFHRSGGAKDTS
eukprot:10593087-Alexandrium_andersonii.AAC.1